MSKFSERVGAIPPIGIQVETMNDDLRNSIWNCLLFLIEGKSDDAVVNIGAYFLNHPRHDLSFVYAGESLKWLWERYKKLQWYQVYDLVEYVVKSPHICRSTITAGHIPRAFNSVFEAKVSGYRFIQGTLSAITNKSEIASIEEAVKSSSSAGLENVRTHLDAALQLLGKKPKPDYRNSIKESISAVEAAAKTISGEHGGGLDAALKEIAKRAEIHKGLQSGFLKLYGYTSDEGGIRHAILEEKSIGFDEAKFMLVACSAFVNFLIGKAEACGLLTCSTKGLAK